MLRFARPLRYFGAGGVRSVQAQAKLTEKDCEEVRIPVPWGHIAGKWWGDQAIPPIVALHGWQDNANSMDTLVPLLDTNSFLALDCPGHGLSSPLPPGTLCHLLDYVSAVRRVVMHHNWPRFSMLGHSYGGFMSYVYAALYPDELRCLINVECARCLLMSYADDMADHVPAGIDRILKIERQMEHEPPTYPLPRLVELYSEGSLGSITPESAAILLKRGAVRKKSSDDGYVLTRDPRVKVDVFGMCNEEYLKECARGIKCRVLSVQAKGGFVAHLGGDVYRETLKILGGSSRLLQHVEVEGTHHTHLNTPHFVAPHINEFLAKLD